MSTHVESPETDSADAPDRRLRPHQLSLILGIGMGVFILVSGVLPQITHWHNDNEVHRTVFGNIPGPLQIAFYTVIPVMVVWGAFQFAARMRNWERGGPAKRRTTTKNVKRRAGDVRAGLYMQTLLRDSAAGLMHSMIYFGFLVLMGVTTVLEIDHQMPESLKFLHGGTYKAYSFVGDLAGTVFTVGVIWAIVRRYIQRPYRIRIKTKPEHAVILGTFLAIGITGFGAEAFRIAVDGTPDYEKWSFIGYPIATWIDGMSASAISTWHQWWWIAHVLSFVVFLAIFAFEFPEWNFGRIQRPLKTHRTIEKRFESRCPGHIKYRRHDKQRQKERQAENDLVGRRLGRPHRLTQYGENDQDPGERRHCDQHGGQQGQHRHDQKNLNTQRIIAATVGIGRSGDQRNGSLLRHTGLGNEQQHRRKHGQ